MKDLQKIVLVSLILIAISDVISAQNVTYSTIFPTIDHTGLLSEK